MVLRTPLFSKVLYAKQSLKGFLLYVFQLGYPAYLCPSSAHWCNFIALEAVCPQFALVIKLFVLQTLRLCIWLFMLPKSSTGGIQQGKAHSVKLTKLHCWAFFTAASCGAGRQPGSNCCFSGCQPAPPITANVKQKQRTLMLKKQRRNFSEKNVY